jgi:3-oxoacyl-[acyl-carrier-protein] synthase-3
MGIDNIGISGLAVYEPETVISLDKVKESENLSDEFLKYIGLKEIHVAGEGEYPCDMAVKSAEKAIKNAGLTSDDIDILIYSNAFLPEYFYWSDYAYIQEKLGIKNAFSFKIWQGCNSQILAFDYARAKLISSPSINNILIVSAERNDTNFINRFTSAGSCIYGDGSSAVVVSRNSRLRFVDLALYTDGAYAKLHYQQMGGLKNPPNINGLNQMQYRIEPRKTCGEHLKTKELKTEFWNTIIDNSLRLIDKMLNDHGLAYSDVKKLICYNMSREIISETCKRMYKTLNDSSFYITERYGHIGSSDLAFNLTKMLEDKKIEPKDYTLLLTCGMGFSWGIGLLYFD